jgi:hypothetical protein
MTYNINKILNFVDIIFHVLFETSFRRQGLALRIGPNRVGVLPEDRDRVKSPKRLNYKLKWRITSRK